MDDEARFAQAKQRVRQLSGFYQHLAVYLLVNTLLVAINLLTSPHVLWFFWPLLGWGIGIVAHAAAVFWSGRFWGKEWEERKIKEILARDEPMI